MLLDRVTGMGNRAWCPFGTAGHGVMLGSRPLGKRDPTEVPKWDHRLLEIIIIIPILLSVVTLLIHKIPEDMGLIY